MREQHGGDVYTEPVRLDFSVSLNPLGMPKALRDAVLSSSGSWEQYPDIRQRKLRQAAAGWYRSQGLSLSPEYFIFGGGASELLQAVFFSERPKRVLLPVPSFGEYRRMAEACGAEIRFLTLSEESGFDLAQALPELLRALREEYYDMLVLASPNNPTGKAVCADILREIAGVCRNTGTLLLLDECFGWFLPDRGRFSLLPEIAAHPEDYGHVLVLDSLTKICAMPGLRLGYAIASSDRVREEIFRSMQPWPVSAPAEAAGCCAFDGILREEVKKVQRMLQKERDYLAGGLRESGLKVYDSDANYLLIRCRDAEGLKKACLARGILIRSCADYEGLNSRFFRVCVKTREENRELINAIRQICGENAYG